MQDLQLLAKYSAHNFWEPWDSVLCGFKNKTYLWPHGCLLLKFLLSLNTCDINHWTSPIRPGHHHLLVDIFMISIVAFKKLKYFCVFWRLQYCKIMLYFSQEVGKKALITHLWIISDVIKILMHCYFCLWVFSKRSQWSCIREWIFQICKHIPSIQEWYLRYSMISKI